jgi:putative transposase
MKQEDNGKLGDWASKSQGAKPVEVKTKAECLELFRQDVGYRKASATLGLRPYTVRDWLRRFKAGDESWATRDGRKFARGAEARDLVKYRHEIKAFVQCSGAASPRDGSRVRAAGPLRRGEDQVAGVAEHASAIPLYRADGAREQILAGGARKKKEIDAVRALVAGGRTVKEACRVAGIRRSTYYRARKPSEKSRRDAALVELMCEIENDAHVSSTYGVERLTGEVNNRLLKDGTGLAAKILRNGGERVNHKRVHRLMKAHGIHSRIRRKKHPDGYYKDVKEMLKANRAPNILNRGFASERPMAKLTTDVTYIPCSDRKFVYLSPLLDLFNHEIVSYSVGTVNSEELVRRMLAAVPPEALKGALVHNDQGSVYWSKGWVALCEKLRIVRSMSRRGECWDNALSENFFSSMKVDLGLTKTGYKTLMPARGVRDLVGDYIPWYNMGRIQKRLNYLSPVSFREAYLDKALPVIGEDRPDAEPGIFLGGAAGSRLGPSARPFGDGAPPPLRPDTRHAFDSTPADLVYLPH